MALTKYNIKKTKQSIKHRSGWEKQPSIAAVDAKWSFAVKKRAGFKCEHCGKHTGLNSHHIFSRSNRATRWHVPNGICLCVACHTFSSKFSAHKTPTEFTEWLKEHLGEDAYGSLRLRARNSEKRKLSEIVKEI